MWCPIRDPRAAPALLLVLALGCTLLPFALLHRTHSDWLVPFITMLVAYPLVSLDQIGVQLQNPFAVAHLSHLPLGDISATIEKNALDLLEIVEQDGPRPAGAEPESMVVGAGSPGSN